MLYCHCANIQNKKFGSKQTPTENETDDMKLNGIVDIKN